VQKISPKLFPLQEYTYQSALTVTCAGGSTLALPSISDWKVQGIIARVSSTRGLGVSNMPHQL
jgi:hypothetical protein